MFKEKIEAEYRVMTSNEEQIGKGFKEHLRKEFAKEKIELIDKKIKRINTSRKKLDIERIPRKRREIALTKIRTRIDELNKVKRMLRGK